MSLYLMADNEYDKLSSMAEKISSVDSAAASLAANGATPMQYNRGKAVISIKGVLEPERIGAYDFWGVEHTAYSDIRAQVAEAVGSGAKKIRFDIDSPGGNIMGMLQTMKDVAAARKSGIKTESVIGGTMASAAAMVGMQSEIVTSTSEADIVGSMGVVRTAINLDFIKEITNHESPNKRPDMNTKDGVDAIKDELSDIYNVVMPHVASARGVSMEKINSDWGKGGIMTAKTALSVGMIDQIKEPKPAGRSGTTKGSNMNRDELKAQHPDLFNAVFAEGKEAGKAEFQELASTHAELAKISGDNERALSDIAAGKQAGPACTVHHTKVAANKTMIDAHQDETPAPVGEGSDPQADAHADADKNKDSVGDELEASAKSFYGDMGAINV